jgi:hypothetical protein
MNWATVEPVPTPSTIPSSTYAIAASAARRFLSVEDRILLPLKTTVPAYAGTVDYFRRRTFSLRPFSCLPSSSPSLLSLP